MSLFQDVVVMLGRRGAVEIVADAVGAPDAETAQVGVVVSLPLVIDGLDRWLTQPDSGTWLAGRLTTIGEGAPTDTTALLDDLAARRLGREITERLFGLGSTVGQRVAGRAGLTPATADELLGLTAAAFAAHLVGDRDLLLPSELVNRVATERHVIVSAGWEPWITEARAVEPTDDGTPSAATEEVLRRTINLGLGRRRFRATDRTDTPDDGPERRKLQPAALSGSSATNRPTRVSGGQQRRPQREDRPPAALIYGVFAVVAALLLAATYLVVTRFGPEPIEPLGPNATTQPTDTTDTTADSGG
ncbi:MAG: hypothetical protein AAGD35_17370 [Actinomycetota bacterium]